MPTVCINYEKFGLGGTCSKSEFGRSNLQLFTLKEGGGMVANARSNLDKLVKNARQVKQEKIERELKTKAGLLDKANALEEFGLTVKRLEKLVEQIEYGGIGSRSSSTA